MAPTFFVGIDRLSLGARASKGQQGCERVLKGFERVTGGNSEGSFSAGFKGLQIVYPDDSQSARNMDLQKRKIFRKVLIRVVINFYVFRFCGVSIIEW